MVEPVISVDTIGKRYRIISASTARYHTLRERLSTLVSSPFRRLFSKAKGPKPSGYDWIWALRDVSFEVPSGEVLGIIGKNGSGKTTLLKILSRITEPTSGFARIKGRVGSLLEVGTGFHPELSGRENTYLNGAILGMRKQEIDRKFDEIMAFAQIEKFADTPVKPYSSGMYVRLAFSVAAHLEPEILLVDEVLAVGDAEFQRRCMGKMQDVAGEGRTVLFVSHNLSSVRQLCDRCILLEKGTVRAIGTPEEAISQYVNTENFSLGADVEVREWPSRSGTAEGQITRIRVFNSSGERTNVIGIGEPFRVRLQISLPPSTGRSVIGLEIKRTDGLPVLNLRSDSQGQTFRLTGEDVFDIDIPGLPVYPGTYVAEPWFAFKNGRRIDHVHEALWLSFGSHGHFESEQMIQPARGVLLADCQWRHSESSRVEP